LRAKKVVLLKSRATADRITGGRRRAVAQNRGAAVWVAITVQEKDGAYRRFDAVRIDIAQEDVDRYVVYRLIPPMDHFWVNIGIYQRDLEGFSERPVIENQNFSVGSDGCVNCHSLQPAADRMSLRFSASRQAVVVIRTECRGKSVRRVGFSKSPANTSWHPDQRHRPLVNGHAWNTIVTSRRVDNIRPAVYTRMQPVYHARHCRSGPP
jgi:hypothetical protein